MTASDPELKVAPNYRHPGRRGEYLYDFWRDAQHPHGVWRRTTRTVSGGAPPWSRPTSSCTGC
jgi:prolyl oligopeptidase PreP (S9A serine peptidase family)